MCSEINPKNDSKVLFVFGGGGHEEQALRLYSRMREYNSELDFIFATSSVREHDLCVKKISEVRDKEKANIFSLVKSSFIAFCAAYDVIKKHNVKCIIATGPGECIPFIIMGKAFRVQVFYIETWSRFYSKSLSGRFAYFLSDFFYVQNKELLSLYPKAIYSGRL